MTINRSALRRNTAQDLLKKVKEAAAKNEHGSEKDERFWQPFVDTNGNGFAIIRFLPAKTEDSLPFVKTYSHGFKVNGKWYIEDCPTTIGEECPVCQANNELWNSGYEADKTIVRERKRRLRYVSNILVIKDPKNPENEGKIFLFGYGQKIHEKLISAINPPEEYGEEPRDPFSFFDGCVLKLKIKNKDSFRNYDDSTIEPATDLYDGDEDKLMAVLESMYSLDEFVDPKKFKAYDRLKMQFDKVIGTKTEEPEKNNAYDEDDVPFETEAPARQYGDKSKKVESKEDEDDDLAFFKQLAEED